MAAIDADPTRNGDQAFTFVGTAAFGGGGKAQVRYVLSGGETIVQVDAGDGVADMSIRLTGAIALTKTDFLL